MCGSFKHYVGPPSDPHTHYQFVLAWPLEVLPTEKLRDHQAAARDILTQNAQREELKRQLKDLYNKYLDKPVTQEQIDAVPVHSCSDCKDLPVKLRADRHCFLFMCYMNYELHPPMFNVTHIRVPALHKREREEEQEEEQEEEKQSLQMYA